MREGLPIQDAGARAAEAPPGAVFVYHVHGRRQGYGACKLHLRPDCPALLRWRPGSIGGEQLARALTREWRATTEDVPGRICWPAGGR